MYDNPELTMSLLVYFIRNQHLNHMSDNKKDLLLFIAGVLATIGIELIFAFPFFTLIIKP